jgi:hypothetical protein
MMSVLIRRNFPERISRNDSGKEESGQIIRYNPDFGIGNLKMCYYQQKL